MEWEIYDDHVAVTERNLSQTLHYTIPFANLHWHPSRFRKNGHGSFFAALLLGFVTYIVFFKGLASGQVHYFWLSVFGIATLSCIYLFVFARTPYLVIPVLNTEVDTPLVLIEGKPSEEAVDEFVGALYEEWLSFWRMQVERHDPEATLTQELARLATLKDIGAVTDGEYEILKAQIIRDFVEPKGGLGFRLEPTD